MNVLGDKTLFFSLNKWTRSLINSRALKNNAGGWDKKKVFFRMKSVGGKLESRVDKDRIHYD